MGNATLEPGTPEPDGPTGTPASPATREPDGEGQSSNLVFAALGARDVRACFGSIFTAEYHEKLGREQAHELGSLGSCPRCVNHRIRTRELHS